MLANFTTPAIETAPFSKKTGKREPPAIYAVQMDYGPKNIGIAALISSVDSVARL
jgi:hypothetical protein